MSDLVVSDEGPIRTLRMNWPGKKERSDAPNVRDDGDDN